VALWKPRPWHRRLVANPQVSHSTALTQVLSDLGLTSGLTLLLDAGDLESYASGQKWLDRSGNGYDFFLGADATASATDPTFNSDGYFTFDAGDFFTYDTTNETWMQNLHKDNAAFTLLSWVYTPVNSANYCFVGTAGATFAAVGISFYISTTNKVSFRLYNATGSTGLDIDTTATVSAGAWHFCGITLDEAAGTGSLFLDSVAEAKTTTYTSPSAASATRTMQIGAFGNNVAPFPNNTRFAMQLAYTTALSDANVAAIFNATRGRFGV
jgi:hypothetical protein